MNSKRLTQEPETLTKWRSSHKGPPYLKIAGGRVRYDRALLEQWVRDQTQLPGRGDPPDNGGSAATNRTYITSAQNRFSQPPPSSSDHFPLLLVARDFFLTLLH